MKISIISGSHRKDGQSLKVAKHIESRLLELGVCDQTHLLSLSENPLPLWEEKIWEGDTQWQARLKPIAEELTQSDGFVVIAPEYHGMAPAGLKNFFLCFGKNELAHKPALLVGVSSVDGGAYPIAELRMSSYKNSRICYLPEQLIVRNVESVLNEEAGDADSADAYFRGRIDWTLKQLEQYATALKTVRASGVTDMSDFGNGM
ncbi:MAG: NAD(P)H-dependent oxidoreductase [Arenicellales bacterium]